MFRVGALLLGAAFALASLGCDRESQPDDAPKPAVQMGELKTTDLVVGKGAEAARGDRAYVRYVGKLRNGKVFDSNTTNLAVPLIFVIGAKGVIEGWDKGVVGMRVGGKRKLEVPYQMAYGDSSPSELIPARSDLIFEIDLLDLIKPGEENFYDFEDTVVGSGRQAKDGDTVVVDFVCKLVNGKEIDSSKDYGKPTTFKVGAGEALPGVDAGVVGMRVGGKRKLRLPPNLAYALGGTQQIPTNSILLVDLTLKAIR